MPDFLKDFGQRVRSLRESRGMTQPELATAVETSVPTILSIEKGNSATNVILADRLAKILGVSISTLFGQKETVGPIEALQILEKAILGLAQSKSWLTPDIVEDLSKVDEGAQKHIQRIIDNSLGRTKTSDKARSQSR